MAAGLREPAPVRWALIGVAALYVGVMILMPLGAVLTEAFRKGLQAWLAAIAEPDARVAAPRKERFGNVEDLVAGARRLGGQQEHSVARVVLPTCTSTDRSGRGRT